MRKEIHNNSSSRDAKDSLHGTAISITQHIKEANDGAIKIPLAFTMNDNKITELLHKYTIITIFTLKLTNLYPPAVQV